MLRPMNDLSIPILILGLALCLGCQPGEDGTEPAPGPADNGSETDGEPPTRLVVRERGDAGRTCETCQELADVPAVVMGEIDPPAGGDEDGEDGDPDFDCYCFQGDADVTYLVGITGNDRRMTAQGPGETEPRHGTDGHLLYQPLESGRICLCVQGGAPGAYLLTLTPE